MKAEEWRKRHGLPPAGSDRARRRPVHSETGLTIAVASWLRSLEGLDQQLVWTHVPNERRDKLEAIRFHQMGVRSGVADFIFWLDEGGTLAVELKTETGSQQKSQREFERDLGELSHPYVLARSVDQVKEALEEAGVQILETPASRLIRTGSTASSPTGRRTPRRRAG